MHTSVYIKRYFCKHLTYLQIILEGRTGASYRGDIAIDDVMVSEGPCPDYGNCDFERDMCGYTNKPYIDQFEWQLGSGSTSSVTTGSNH